MNGFYEPEVSGHGSRAPGSKSQDQPAGKGRKWSGQLLPPQESSFLKEVGLSGRRRRKMVGTKSFALTIKLVDPCIIH